MRTILWQAIKAEENLAESYRRWAEQLNRQELQQLFRQLAEEHRQHAANLQSCLARQP